MYLKKVNKLKITALATILILMVQILVAGCTTKTQTKVAPANSENSNSSSNSTQPSTANSNNPNVTQHPVKLTLYFPTTDGDGLVPVERTVNVPDQEVIKAMFKELENPPAGLAKPLPEGTQLLGASVKDGVATVNLSKKFRENFTGGSTGEQMVLYSIVNTLTTLPNVQSVQFLLEGEKSVAVLGEIDTSTPLKKNENLIRQKQ